MRVQVLGCSGGIGAELRTTSLRIDDDILIDTGTGIGDLPLAEMRRIEHVFLTHSHLDHTAGLPLLLDTVFDMRNRPIVMHGREETLAALRQHVFNWVMWPDFAELPSPSAPALRYAPMRPGSRMNITDRSIHMIEVRHAVPAVGYCVESHGRVFAFSGDTTTNDLFWEVLNECPRVDVLMVETAFADHNEKLAELACHYCPRTLALDMKKLRHDPEIYITHLKPGSEELIFSEVRAALLDRRVHRLRGGEIFEL
ncbi:MAG: MBL fold metallo-hydrolase [Gammaproteobacteria bacterium]